MPTISSNPCCEMSSLVRWRYFACVILCVCSALGGGGATLEQTKIDTLRKQHLRSIESRTPEEWLYAINHQLLLVNQLTAFYAWELTVCPTDALGQQSVHFNAIKAQWTRVRCAEARAWLTKETTTLHDLERIVTLLCRGPSFSAAETRQLSADLYAMQEAFVSQAVCFPRHFNVCHGGGGGGSAELWRQTYARHRDGSVGKLLPHVDTDPIRRDASAFRCLLAEPHMDLIMAGDQSAFFEAPLAHNLDDRRRCTLDTFDATLWAWQAWRQIAGPAVWPPFRAAIGLMNAGARRNGYADIGAVWREELDIGDDDDATAEVMAQLWRHARPLYERLHGVVRNALWHKVQRTAHTFERRDPIPAHMLGSMWSQNWSVFAELLLPETKDDSLRARLKRKRLQAHEIVAHADDFYTSMGLPAMGGQFWRRSVLGFENETLATSCHGTAANMFEPEDVRMIFCVPPTGGTMENIYVAVHEMGHLHYFLGYMSGQPPVFQDAHSALQEAVGDAVHLGFMAPQHLHRLGLLADADLMVDRQHRSDDERADAAASAFDAPYERAVHATVDCTERTSQHSSTATRSAADLRLLLRSALVRIAQLPFEYLLDVYRWDLFAERIPAAELNAHLWHLMETHQGVRPPREWTQTVGSARQFDAGAKYHVADNTPFARYFLASFLQAQIFRGLCEVTVFGAVRPGVRLPMPLHRCDIYGSRRAGTLLRQAFAMGTSRPWTEVLFVLTGERNVKADAFIEYYAPLNGWLEHLIKTYDIPIGW